MLYIFLGHLPHQKRRVLWRRDNFTSTYVTFSPNGRELLANMGSEQIYLFDVFHGNPILLDSLNFKNFVAKCGTIHEGKSLNNKMDNFCPCSKIRTIIFLRIKIMRTSEIFQKKI